MGNEVLQASQDQPHNIISMLTVRLQHLLNNHSQQSGGLNEGYSDIFGQSQ